MDYPESYMKCENCMSFRTLWKSPTFQEKSTCCVMLSNEGSVYEVRPADMCEMWMDKNRP